MPSTERSHLNVGSNRHVYCDDSTSNISIENASTNPKNHARSLYHPDPRTTTINASTYLLSPDHPDYSRMVNGRATLTTTRSPARLRKDVTCDSLAPDKAIQDTSKHREFMQTVINSLADKNMVCGIW